MSAPAVAPIVAADAEETLPMIVPQVVIDSRGEVDEHTWRAPIVASAIIVFCMIACFLVLNWMCCTG